MSAISPVPCRDEAGDDQPIVVDKLIFRKDQTPQQWATDNFGFIPTKIAGTTGGVAKAPAYPYPKEDAHTIRWLMETRAAHGTKGGVGCPTLACIDFDCSKDKNKVKVPNTSGKAMQQLARKDESLGPVLIELGPMGVHAVGLAEPSWRKGTGKWSPEGINVDLFSGCPDDTGYYGSHFACAPTAGYRWLHTLDNPEQEFLAHTGLSEVPPALREAVSYATYTKKLLDKHGVVEVDVAPFNRALAERLGALKTAKAADPKLRAVGRKNEDSIGYAERVAVLLNAIGDEFKAKLTDDYNDWLAVAGHVRVAMDTAGDDAEPIKHAFLEASRQPGSPYDGREWEEEFFSKVAKAPTGASSADGLEVLLAGWRKEARDDAVSQLHKEFDQFFVKVRSGEGWSIAERYTGRTISVEGLKGASGLYEVDGQTGGLSFNFDLSDFKARVRDIQSGQGKLPANWFEAFISGWKEQAFDYERLAVLLVGAGPFATLPRPNLEPRTTVSYPEVFGELKVERMPKRDELMPEVLAYLTLLVASAKGNSALALWQFKWRSFLVQHPGVKNGTYLHLKGEQGCGKSTLGVLLCEAFGSRGVASIKSDTLASRFQSRILTKAYGVLNDATGLLPGCREVGVLKSLTTDEWQESESKGKDAIEVYSPLSLELSTNLDQVFRLFGRDERREALFIFPTIDEFHAGAVAIALRTSLSMDPDRRNGFYQQLISLLACWDGVSFAAINRPPESEDREEAIATSRHLTKRAASLDRFIYEHLVRPVEDEWLAFTAGKGKPLSLYGAAEGQVVNRFEWFERHTRTSELGASTFPLQRGADRLSPKQLYNCLVAISHTMQKESQRDDLHLPTEDAFYKTLLDVRHPFTQKLMLARLTGSGRKTFIGVRIDSVLSNEQERELIDQAEEEDELQETAENRAPATPQVVCWDEFPEMAAVDTLILSTGGARKHGTVDRTIAAALKSLLDEVYATQERGQG